MPLRSKRSCGSRLANVSTRPRRAAPVLKQHATSSSSRLWLTRAALLLLLALVVSSFFMVINRVLSSCKSCKFRLLPIRLGGIKNRITRNRTEATFPGGVIRNSSGASRLKDTVVFVWNRGRTVVFPAGLCSAPFLQVLSHRCAQRPFSNSSSRRSRKSSRIDS